MIVMPMSESLIQKDYDTAKSSPIVTDPISFTEQELGLAATAPLLTPADNKMMNRISSSIIRELSSNMLIPYTRLKLMECVGQG